MTDTRKLSEAAANDLRTQALRALGYTPTVFTELDYTAPDGRRYQGYYVPSLRVRLALSREGK